MWRRSNTKKLLAIILLTHRWSAEAMADIQYKQSRGTNKEYLHYFSIC